MTTGVDLSITELIKLGKSSTFALSARKHIKSHYSGIKPSKIKGHGIDFDQIREYQFGDDIRSIDWKATAKLQKTYIRTYKEERQRPVLLLVDFSANMFFGSKVAFKSVVAARLATLLGFLAAKHDDRVGALIYSQNDHLEIKPKIPKLSVQALIRALVYLHAKALNADSKKTTNTLYSALLRLKRSTKPGSLIFIISDFFDFGQKSCALLQQLSQHNELCLNFIYDPLEKTAPKAGRYLLNDGKIFKQMDTFDKKNRDAYAHNFIQKFDFLSKFAYQNRNQFIPVATDDDLTQILKNNLSVFKR